MYGRGQGGREETPPIWGHVLNDLSPSILRSGYGPVMRRRTQRGRHCHCHLPHYKDSHYAQHKKNTANKKEQFSPPLSLSG